MEPSFSFVQTIYSKVAPCNFVGQSNTQHGLLMTGFKLWRSLHIKDEWQQLVHMYGQRLLGMVVDSPLQGKISKPYLCSYLWESNILL